MKNKTKKRLAFAAVAVLSLAAAATVSMAVLKASATRKTTLPESEPVVSDGSVEAEIKSYFIAEVESSLPELDLEGELKPQIEEVVDDVTARCGGDWSVYVYVPYTDSELSVNVKKMQAASVIKLFIMGAVYDEYDEIVKAYPDEDIPELIESMITVSSNEDADWLVKLLGRGDNSKGRQKVNEFCKKYGFENTIMERMMGDENIYSDNYTTTMDSGKFLTMVLEGEFTHSKDMLNYLKAQERTNKIPDGVPKNVMTANKTGELEDVENDSAIIFAGRPYILCVMSDGVGEYQSPIDAIADISTVTYNYLAPKLVRN